jgi:hypothetical protein
MRNVVCRLEPIDVGTILRYWLVSDRRNIAFKRLRQMLGIVRTPRHSYEASIPEIDYYNSLVTRNFYWKELEWKNKPTWKWYDGN